MPSTKGRREPGSAVLRKQEACPLSRMRLVAGGSDHVRLSGTRGDRRLWAAGGRSWVIASALTTILHGAASTAPPTSTVVSFEVGSTMKAELLTSASPVSKQHRARRSRRPDWEAVGVQLKREHVPRGPAVAMQGEVPWPES